MKYYIHYAPVFEIKSKVLSGYDIFVGQRVRLSLTTSGFDILAVETDSDTEFERFSAMLKTMYDPSTDTSFVDKHPKDILNYLRGIKEKVKKSSDWESDINNWKLSYNGERT